MTREGSVCRLCTRSRLARAGKRRAFATPSAQKHYAPDLPFKLEHIFVDCEVSPEEKWLKGSVTHRVRVTSPHQKRIVLDQIDLRVLGAKVAGQAVKFHTEGRKLVLALNEAPAAGSTFEFEVRYEAHQPKRGLYFTGPDANFPKKRHQVWSQGQDEDNRYWFPTFDYPNQKATTEIRARVPKGYTAVSNGSLLGKTELGALTQFHYKLDVAHVTYLVTLIVAELAFWKDEGPRGLPVEYFVEPGREEDGKRAFSNTPAMIAAFEKRIGVPYAYSKYAQTAVQDFIFGGMENTSATTQTDLTLHDARAHLDFSSDPLVSHELAHQWFGDLLTCRDWSHGWLNEGFATFLERVWIEENKTGNGPAGLDEGKYYSHMDLKEYLADDGERYRRPIVCNTYAEPIDLFDTHLYQKGGLVLNLIRATLGEEGFWQSIKVYVERHRGQNVETLDLIRAIEDTTGRNLRRLFDEWVFGAGFPEFELSYEWHDDKKLAEIVIEQKQTKGLAEVTEDGATTSLFHLPVTLTLTTEKGTETHVIDVGSARERVFLPADSKPLMVRFDPNSTIPKTLKFPRPKEMLLHQLKHDTDCMGRIEAARELGKVADREVVKALGEQLRNDSFWGVQAEVAAVLGEVRLETARDELITGLGVSESRARRSVVRALGSYLDKKSAVALEPFTKKDPSYFVEAEAYVSWAKTTSHSDPARVSEVETFLIEKALTRKSYRELLRSHALRALGALPGVGRGERPRAVDTLIDWAKAGPERDIDARGAAMEALGNVARIATPDLRARIFEVFRRLADEDNFRTRMRLVATLEISDSIEAIDVLAKVRSLDGDGRVKREAWIAMSDLELAGGTPQGMSKLQESMQALQEETMKLKNALETLQADRKAAAAPVAAKAQ